MCRKLKGFLCIVDGANLTENSLFEVCTRCAVALPNEVVKPSCFHDIMRYLNCVTGKPFPFLVTLCWLDVRTMQLDPTFRTDAEMVSVSLEINASKVDEDVTSGYPISSQNWCHEDIAKDNDRKRTVDHKAEKVAQKKKPEASMEEHSIKEAPNNWTTSSSETNNASLKAECKNAKEKAKIAQKELELKEEAFELKDPKLLFFMGATMIV